MNEKKVEKSEPVKESGSPAPAKNSRMFFIGILAVVLAFQAVLGIVIVRMATARPVESAPPPPPPRVQLDSLGRVDSEATIMGETTEQSPIEAVVNIAGTDGERFLKTEVVLEYDERQAKKGGGGKEGKGPSPLADAIAQRIPKYKGYLIDQLSKMSLEEITAPEAKNQIRKNFMKMANESLPAQLGDIRNVYFTEYIIQ
jgi:flagellar basal body-associated protein FliL